MPPVEGPPIACLLQPAEETPVGGRTRGMQDTSVCDPEPDKSSADHREHLYTRVTPGEEDSVNDECVFLLRFPVREDLPKNMTVLKAWLNVFSPYEYWGSSAQRAAAFERNLTLRNVMVPWEEDTVAWSTVSSPSSHNGSAAPMAAGLKPRFSPPLIQQQDVPKTFDVTVGVDGQYRGYAPHLHGWRVSDDRNPNPCADTEGCRQTFHSSASRTDNGEPAAGCDFGTIPTGTRVGETIFARDYCWPKLNVLLDPNRPIVRNMTFRTNATAPPRVYDADVQSTPDDAIFVSGKVPFNLSVDAKDKVGRIVRGTIRIVNETGTTYVNEDFQHKQFMKVFRHRLYPDRDFRLLWSVKAFGLPEGKYYVNLTVEDTDGRRSYLNMTKDEPALWVDNTPPRIDVTNLTRELGGGTAQNITFALADPRGIDAARLEVTTPSGRVVTVRAKPAVTDGERNGAWYATRPWSEPGVHRVVVWANDTLGNANTTNLTFRVLDTKLPQACGVRFEASELRFGAYYQEEGGRVYVQACAEDETNLTAKLEVAGPDGAAEQTMTRRADGRFETNWTAGSEGRYTLVVRTSDVDANVREIGRAAVVVEPAAGPRAVQLRPVNAGWANATPVVALTFVDHNLDRASVRLEMRVGDGAFQRVTPFVSTAKATEADVVLRGLTFQDGADVAFRAWANDTLGRATGPVEWSFRVDAKPPRVNLTVTGDRAPGPVAAYLTRAATVDAQASDDASGVGRLEAKWSNVDQRLETPWQTVEGALRLVDPQVDRGAGLYELRVRAVDAVGNVAPPEEFRYALDPEPPRGNVTVGAGELFVDVTDAGSGLASLIVGSRLQGDPAFRIADLAREVERLPQGGRFVVESSVVSKGETLEYYVTAVDRLGNRMTVGSPLEPVRHAGRNHAPELDVEGPEDGAEVKGPIDVRWTATDPDLDTVRVDVRIRPVVLLEGEVLASNAPARGLAGWDSRQAPDGLYALEVVARDLETETRHEVRFLVNNTGKGIGRLVAPAARVEYLDEVRFEVTLYRPVIEAKVRVFEVSGDARRLVATHPLLDDGRHGDRRAEDGVYTAVYPASEKGRYVTDVEVVYADAGTVVVPGAGAYSVRSSVTSVLERNLLWFVLGGVLVVGLSAFLIVQLMRYGYI